jgi:hypothetical protein
VGDPRERGQTWTTAPARATTSQLSVGVFAVLILDFTALKLGNHSALVTLDWDARRADGTQIRRWRQAYNLIEMAGSWKILLSTFHLD